MQEAGRHVEARGRVGAVLAGLAILVLASVIFITSKSREGVSPVERVFRDVLSPMLSAVSTVSRSISEAWDNVVSLRDAHVENQQLKEQLAALREENMRLQEAERQNRLLREALALPPAVPPAVVFAEVIGRPLNNWWSVVTLNKGERHGVRGQMGVVASEGVVGHVRSVTAFTAEVVLLVDPRSAVGGMVRRTGQPVLVEGLGFPGTELRLRPLDEGIDVQVGDEIVTGGMSHLFQKGIPIGVVTEVVLGPYGLSLEATVEPFVPFGRIEYVAVVVDSGRSTVPAAVGSPVDDDQEGR